MESSLNKSVVLVLNKCWQAINVRTPQDAFCQMATNVATALDITEGDRMQPTPWEQWIQLPIRDTDNYVQTPNGRIRIPTVIVLASFSKVPKTRPRLSPRSIRDRDGNKCQYTGKFLRPEEGSMDHVLPRAKGGKTAWENCVWADKSINMRKGSKLLQEAGLTLLTTPKAPPLVPAMLSIRNTHRIKDWEPFLVIK